MRPVGALLASGDPPPAREGSFPLPLRVRPAGKHQREDESDGREDQPEQQPETLAVALPLGEPRAARGGDQPDEEQVKRDHADGSVVLVHRNLRRKPWPSGRGGSRRPEKHGHDRAIVLPHRLLYFRYSVRMSRYRLQPARAMTGLFAPTHGLPSWRKAGKDEGFRITGQRGRHWDVRRLNRNTGEVRVPNAGWARFRWSRDLPADARSFRVTRDPAGRWHAALSTGEMLTVPGLT